MEKEMPKRSVEAMISGLYSVYDRAGEQFGPIFEAPTKAVACRSFVQMFIDPKRVPDQNLRDYALFYFGNFDQISGDMILEDKPALIMEATLVRKVPNAKDLTHKEDT